MNLIDDCDLICVNPSISICTVSDTLIQLIFPDRTCLSMEGDSAKLGEFLSHEGPLQQDVWCARLEDLGMDPLASAETFEGLRYSNILVPSRGKDIPLFEAVFQSESSRVGIAQEFLSQSNVENVAIFGTGEICDVVTRATGEVYSSINNQTAEADMKIVCSDSENFPDLMQLWSDAGPARFKVGVWFDGGSVRLGPFQVAGETACIHCFAKRRISSAKFVEEAVSYHKHGISKKTGAGLGDAGIALTTFIISRFLHSVQNNLFHILQPGYVESWSILTGEKSKSYVLRDPYCKCCGMSEKSPAAVRTIL